MISGKPACHRAGPRLIFFPILPRASRVRPPVG